MTARSGQPAWTGEASAKSIYPEQIADRQLRSTFDQDAGLYDRVRPGYPAEVFDDLASIAGLNPAVRVLEIGPGTGQATLLLAKRQYHVTAIEIGPKLAAIARRKLRAFPKVKVIVAPFEDWPLPAEPFDAVVSATAFHWLDPRVRLTKAAMALRPGGSLAIISTHHIEGGTKQFFEDSQPCYERWTQAKPGFRLPTASQVSAEDGDALRSAGFEPPVLRSYQWEHAYSAAEYIDLLSTYSESRALEEGSRQGLLDCIASLIVERYGGRIRKRYLNLVLIARRRADAPDPD